ncbi:hypothetical protein J699_01706 [Acinetobacter sp. 1000160]|nr:hypothetical protein J522_0697 [Acinetobacter baumannii 146457]EYT21452.1 hypothetical protein J699_01706 [Acinetobacter sp. 1000160]
MRKELQAKIIQVCDEKLPKKAVMSGFLFMLSLPIKMMILNV